MTLIQIRRGNAAAWTAANPILAQGELGMEIDTFKIKVGNGSSTWTALSYFPVHWDAVNGKPAVIAAGADKAAARAAIDAASLDSNGRVPVSQLPASLMQYQGVWDASSNTPSLANGTGDNGDVYRVTVAGDRNLGAGSISFAVGDYVIYNPSGVWEKSDTTDAVATVSGRTGNVTLASADVGLGNVDNTSNATERAAVATLSNKRITPRVGTVASSATPAIDVGLFDQFNITALAAAITSMTSGLTGSPVDGQKLLIRIKDNGTARALSWGASFVASGAAALPTTTVVNKTHLVGFIYDSATAKWVCVAVDAAGY
jgi:hypothetical protein